MLNYLIETQLSTLMYSLRRGLGARSFPPSAPKKRCLPRIGECILKACLAINTVRIWNGTSKQKSTKKSFRQIFEEGLSRGWRNFKPIFTFIQNRTNKQS